MILAEVSSGRSLLATSSPTKLERPGSAADGGVLDRSAAAVAGRGEGRGPHRDDLLGVLRLHGLDRVAGIDRPLERIGRNHLDDFGDLHHVEQRRDARHHVLEARGRGRDERVIARRQRHDQRGQRLGEIVRIGRAFGEQHLRDALQVSPRLRPPPLAPSAAGDEHMDRGAEFGSRGQRLVGGSPSATRGRVRQSATWSSDNPGFVLELRHQFGDVLDLDACLAARRFGGLEDFEARREIDAVLSDALLSAIGFFFAFMMFGRLA